MELILDNVSYSSKEWGSVLSDVSYSFREEISFVNGISGYLLKELLFLEKKADKGYVMLGSSGSVYDVAYLGMVSYLDFKELNIYDELVYFHDYYGLGYSDVDGRINQALKMVGVSSYYVGYPFKKMSLVELKKMMLVKAMFLNAKILILDDFEVGLSNQELVYLKKLLLKLNSMFKKNVIVVSENLGDYLNIINNIVVFRDGKIVFNGDKSCFYDDSLYNYIEKPEIVSFIDFLNDNGHKIDNYIDIKELLKAIYRDVENK